MSTLAVTGVYYFLLKAPNPFRPKKTVWISNDIFDKEKGGFF